MLSVHSNALSGVEPLFHEFLAYYKENSKIIYGFVEGKDDPSFYRGAIDNMLPDNWDVYLRQAGNKDKVILLYSLFEWSRYSKKRILFFIDRDISDFLGQLLPNESNIYVTENYSIENDIVSRNTCDRVLTEIYKLTDLKKDEKDEILNLFESQLDLFQTEMVSIMVWIIHWRRQGEEPILNKIKMQHLFSANSGIINVNSSPQGLSCKEEYIHNQCSISYNKNSDLSKIEEEFHKINGKGKFIRGKYKLWFLVEFTKSVFENINSFSSNISKPPKINTTLGLNNAIVLIAPRCRLPKSLNRFLNETCIKYIAIEESLFKRWIFKVVRKWQEMWA